MSYIIATPSVLTISVRLTSVIVNAIIIELNFIIRERKGDLTNFAKQEWVGRFVYQCQPTNFAKQEMGWKICLPMSTLHRRKNFERCDMPPVVVHIYCIHFTKISEVMFPSEFLSSTLHSLVKHEPKRRKLLSYMNSTKMGSQHVANINSIYLHTKRFRFSLQKKYLYSLLKQLNLQRKATDYSNTFEGQNRIQKRNFFF